VAADVRGTGCPVRPRRPPGALERVAHVRACGRQAGRARVPVPHARRSFDVRLPHVQTAQRRPGDRRHSGDVRRRRRRLRCFARFGAGATAGDRRPRAGRDRCDPGARCRAPCVRVPDAPHASASSRLAHLAVLNGVVERALFLRRRTPSSAPSVDPLGRSADLRSRTTDRRRFALAIPWMATAEVRFRERSRKGDRAGAIGARESQSVHARVNRCTRESIGARESQSVHARVPLVGLVGSRVRGEPAAKAGRTFFPFLRKAIS